jgi:hypothetical protein
MDFTVILLIVALYLSGVAGYIYWWIRDYDLFLFDLFIGLYAGLIGPLTWVVGYMIHSTWDTDDAKPLIRKRSQ